MILKYILIAVLGSMLANANALTGQGLTNRPIVLGPLVGLILGDLKQGIIIGAALELSYMGVMVIGIASALDMTVVGLLATTYAIVTGQGAELAVTLAIPCSLLMSLVSQPLSFLRVWMAHFMDNAAKEGDIKKFERWHWIMWWLRIVTSAPVYFLALYLGSEAIQAIVDAAPLFLLNGLKVSTTLIPALGFAMLLNLCWSKEVAAFFFIGFVLSIYAGLDNVAIAILGAAFALIAFFFIKTQGNEDSNSAESDSDIVKREPLLDKKTLNKIYWRSYQLEADFNVEKFQGFGFAYMMIPAIKKLYPNPEDQKEALVRHSEFFNTCPTVVTPITGIACAMEEEKSNGANITGAAISNVKVALMGPVAGIGDSIFWGSYRIICTSIACQMGIQGNVLAPFVFLVLFNIPNVLLHYYGLYKAYEMGNSFIKKMYESNVMDKITLCCSIMGMTMIGAMTASLVSISTPFTATIGETVFVLQDLLNAIMPGMLSLIAVFSLSAVLKKQASVMKIIIALMVIGVVGNLIGIL